MKKLKNTQEESTFTESCGNVYEDLGVRDAGVMKIKSIIAMEIQRVMEKRGLTQQEAAACIGVDQPKISAIISGQFRSFSIDRMLRFLEALNIGFEMSFFEKAG